MQDSKHALSVDKAKPNVNANGNAKAKELTPDPQPVPASVPLATADAILEAWSAPFAFEPDTLYSTMVMGDAKAPGKLNADALAEQLKATSGNVFSNALSLAQTHVRAAYQRYVRWDVKDAVQTQQCPLADRTADLLRDIAVVSANELARLDVLANTLSLADNTRERAYLDALHKALEA
jgi:hypothetical protein